MKSSLLGWIYWAFFEILASWLLGLLVGGLLSLLIRAAHPISNRAAASLRHPGPLKFTSKFQSIFRPLKNHKMGRQGHQHDSKWLPKITPNQRKSQNLWKYEIIQKPQYLLCFSNIQPPPSGRFSTQNSLKKETCYVTSHFDAAKSQKVTKTTPKWPPNRSLRVQFVAFNRWNFGFCHSRGAPGHHRSPKWAPKSPKWPPTTPPRPPKSRFRASDYCNYRTALITHIPLAGTIRCVPSTH